MLGQGILRRAAFAAVMLLGTAGCAQVVSGDPVAVSSDSGSVPSRAVTAPKDWTLKGDQYNGIGSWIYDDMLIVATNKRVAAYDRANGTKRWERLPPDGGRFCGASPTIVDGTVSIAHGLERNNNPVSISCHNVSLLRLSAGDLVWTAKVPNDTEASKEYNVGGVLTEVTADRVLVTWNQLLTGFDRADGTPKYRERIGEGARASVYLRGLVVAGKTGYLAVEFGPYGGNASTILVSFDAASGTKTGEGAVKSGEYGFKDPVPLGGFVSTTPLILEIKDDKSSANERLVVFDSSLKVTTTIDIGAPQVTDGDRPPDSLVPWRIGGNSNAYAPRRLLVHQNTLYAMTSGPPHAQWTGNNLVAYDLTTGARGASATIPGHAVIQPITVDGKHVLAATIGSGTDDPIELTRFDLASGGVIDTRKSTYKTSVAGTNSFSFLAADNRAYGVEWDMASNFQSWLITVG